MAQPLALLLQTLIPQQNSWELKLIQNWPQIMGNVSRHVRIEKVQDSTVVLGVYDTRWMQELFLLSNILIDKMNEFLRQPYVKSLRFKTASPNAKLCSKKRSYSSAVHIAKPLTERETVALEKIKDKELVQALKNFRNRCHEQGTLWNNKQSH